MRSAASLYLQCRVVAMELPPRRDFSCVFCTGHSLGRHGPTSSFRSRILYCQCFWKISTTTRTSFPCDAVGGGALSRRWSEVTHRQVVLTVCFLDLHPQPFPIRCHFRHRLLPPPFEYSPNTGTRLQGQSVLATPLLLTTRVPSFEPHVTSFLLEILGSLVTRYAYRGL